ncbi:MAG TPA: hypothetical protein VMW50_09960 [Dehalococcoidia bacterium]|nr:hypothetical protein [Dehalococcoidia bacterium]
MKKSFKWLLGIALVLTLILSPVAGLLGFAGLASAETTQNVTINATPGWLSISNTPDTFDFGTVYATTDEDTTLTGFNVTNGGSVNCSVTIQCDNWTHTSGSNDWIYGAAAENTSRLMFGVEGGSFGVAVPDADGPAVNLTAELNITDSQLWGIEIDAPSSFTHGDSQQTNLTLTGVILG